MELPTETKGDVFCPGLYYHPRLNIRSRVVLPPETKKYSLLSRVVTPPVANALAHGAPSLANSAPRSLASLVPLAPLMQSTTSSGAGKGPVHPATLPPPAMYAGTKRAHDESFWSEPEHGRYQNGTRDKGRSDDIVTDITSMPFKRADGSEADGIRLRY